MSSLPVVPMVPTNSHLLKVKQRKSLQAHKTALKKKSFLIIQIFKYHISTT